MRRGIIRKFWLIGNQFSQQRGMQYFADGMQYLSWERCLGDGTILSKNDEEYFVPDQDNRGWKPMEEDHLTNKMPSQQWSQWSCCANLINDVYLVSLSTTTKIVSMPWNLRSPLMKSMVMSSHPHLRGKWQGRLQRLRGEAFFCWHMRQCCTYFATSICIPKQYHPEAKRR